jgi:osmotically inducible protein OsmC
MSIKKTASAQWKGSVKQGKGNVSTESGALSSQPYGFNTRFEGEAGTNPEELVGAAHASCFSMAFSMMLGEAGFEPEQIDTQATVTLEPDSLTITSVHLKTSGRGSGRLRQGRSGRQGQLPGFQTVYRLDHPGRDSRKLRPIRPIKEQQRNAQYAGLLCNPARGIVWSREHARRHLSSVKRPALLGDGAGRRPELLLESGCLRAVGVIGRPSASIAQ